MELDISSEEELYNKVKPALRCKKHELLLYKIEFVKEEDIWEYCKTHYFHDAKYLTLYQVVDCILNTNNNEYKEYVINKLRIKEDVV